MVWLLLIVVLISGCSQRTPLIVIEELPIVYKELAVVEKVNLSEEIFVARAFTYCEKIYLEHLGIETLPDTTFTDGSSSEAIFMWMCLEESTKSAIDFSHPKWDSFGKN